MFSRFLSRSQDKIYQQIKAHQGVQTSSVTVLGQDLHDLFAVWNCGLKQIFELTVEGYAALNMTTMTRASGDQ